MSQESDDVKVSFCPVPTSEIQAEIMAASVVENSETKKTKATSKKSKNKEQGKRHRFGPRPEVNHFDFDFKKELDRLPFPMNIREVEMSKAQQWRFLELIYDNKDVFMLCDEDLGLCDRLKHTIPTMTDKLVYLLQCTILVQLQAEVHKCLDTWLKQGVIRPYQSPYASLVVIVCKKTGDIHLCVDFRVLNAMTV